VAAAWPGLALRAAVLAILGLGLGTYTLGPLTRAGWGIIDDHEIAHYAGPSGRLAVRDIPGVLLGETEVGMATMVPRFRPGFHALRLTETALWGFVPARWYRVRIAFYALSVVLFGWVVAARIGTLATLGLMAWVLSAPYWVSVWGRLGAAECYGAFGCALWVFGIHLLWPGADASAPGARWRLRTGLAFFIVGNAIVVSAKETLLVAAIPNLVLALMEAQAGRRGGARWWACSIGVAAAALVAVPLVISLSHSGVDIYGRSTALGPRLTVLGAAVIRPTPLHGAFAVAAALWLGTRVAARRGGLHSGEAWQRLTSGLLLASAGGLALLLSQLVLYNGDIPPGSYYQFPAALGGPALLVAAAVCVKAFFRRTGRPRGERAVAFATAALLLGLALLGAAQFRGQREWSRGWAAATREFHERIAAAAAVAHTDPGMPIVVVSGRPLDMEPILSVSRFLRQSGVRNRLTLVLDWAARRSEWTSLEAHVAPGLERGAREGWGAYAPQTPLEPGAPCFSIGLSHEPHPGCRSLGRLW
jgi:hypothetical protein